MESLRPGFQYFWSFGGDGADSAILFSPKVSRIVLRTSVWIIKGRNSQDMFFGIFAMVAQGRSVSVWATQATPQ